MSEKSEFRAVEWVRKIRDRHASLLRGKSPEEIIAFFQEDAGAQNTGPARPRRPAAAKASP